MKDVRPRFDKLDRLIEQEAIDREKAVTDVRYEAETFPRWSQPIASAIWRWRITAPLRWLLQKLGGRSPYRRLSVMYVNPQDKNDTEEVIFDLQD